MPFATMLEKRPDNNFSAILICYDFLRKYVTGHLWGGGRGGGRGTVVNMCSKDSGLQTKNSKKAIVAPRIGHPAFHRYVDTSMKTQNGGSESFVVVSNDKNWVSLLLLPRRQRLTYHHLHFFTVRSVARCGLLQLSLS